MQNREFKILLSQAYEYIKERILDGTLTYNQIYSETGMAREIGISRTPVRDAVHLLYQEGLVDIIPSKGFTLHRLSEQDVIETFEIRSAIEGYCAQKLAMEKDSRAAKKVILELRGAVGKQEAIFNDDGDVELFVENDQAFHSFLVSYGGNRSFMQLFEQHMYRIKKLASYSLTKEGRMEETLSEHRQICDAIQSGDPRGAYEAVLAHMVSPLDINLELIYR